MSRRLIRGIFKYEDWTTNQSDTSEQVVRKFTEQRKGARHHETGRLKRMRTAVDHAASWQTRVPYNARSAGTVRRWLSEVAGNLDTSLLSDLCAVATELVCNSVRHASPLPGDELSVHLQRTDDVVEFAVTDGGANTKPAVRIVDNCSPDGRGLQIVDALTSQWGVSDNSTGRTVWVRFIE